MPCLSQIRLTRRRIRGILVAALLSALSIPPMSIILEIDAYSQSHVVPVASVLVWPFVAVGGYFCYRKILRDMLVLALILMNACLILLTLIGKLMLDGHHGSEEFMFLLFALIIIGVVSVTAFWLKRTAAKMAKEVAP